MAGALGSSFRRDRRKSARLNGCSGSCPDTGRRGVLPGEGFGLLPEARPFEHAVPSRAVPLSGSGRSEERRVGKEERDGWSGDDVRVWSVTGGQTCARPILWLER